jgi:hypothetical protein
MTVHLFACLYWRVKVRAGTRARARASESGPCGLSRICWAILTALLPVYSSSTVSMIPTLPPRPVHPCKHSCPPTTTPRVPISLVCSSFLVPLVCSSSWRKAVVCYGESALSVLPMLCHQRTHDEDLYFLITYWDEQRIMAIFWSAAIFCAACALHSFENMLRKSPFHTMAITK